jgi:hypothetical protein
MQQHCRLKGRSCTSLARTSPGRAKSDVKRLSLPCNSEGKFNPGLTGRQRHNMIDKKAYQQGQTAFDADQIHNPYNESSGVHGEKLWGSWNRGWNDRRQELRASFEAALALAKQRCTKD